MRRDAPETRAATAVKFELFRIRVYEAPNRSQFGEDGKRRDPIDRAAILREALSFALRASAAGDTSAVVGNPVYGEEGAAFQFTRSAKNAGWYKEGEALVRGRGTLAAPVTAIIDYRSEILAVEATSRFSGTNVIARAILRSLASHASFDQLRLSVEANRMYERDDLIAVLRAGGRIRQVTFTVERRNPDDDGPVYDALSGLAEEAGSALTVQTFSPENPEALVEPFNDSARKGNPVSITTLRPDGTRKTYSSHDYPREQAEIETPKNPGMVSRALRKFRSTLGFGDGGGGEK